MEIYDDLPWFLGKRERRGSGRRSFGRLRSWAERSRKDIKTTRCVEKCAFPPSLYFPKWIYLFSCCADWAELRCAQLVMAGKKGAIKCSRQQASERHIKGIKMRFFFVCYFKEYMTTIWYESLEWDEISAKPETQNQWNNNVYFLCAELWVVGLRWEEMK